jgi:hypothetical protein
MTDKAQNKEDCFSYLSHAVVSLLSLFGDTGFAWLGLALHTQI